jgi:hypothetical protein
VHVRVLQTHVLVLHPVFGEIIPSVGVASDQEFSYKQLLQVQPLLLKCLQKNNTSVAAKASELIRFPLILHSPEILQLTNLQLCLSLHLLPEWTIFRPSQL